MPAAPIDLFCERLERLVAIDSPSGSIGQEQVSELVLEWLAPLRVSHTWIDEPDNPARSLSVTLDGDGGPLVALIGHPDTVFAEGTATARPFRRDGDRCFGPGVADMKGGLVLAAMAMERLAAEPGRPFGQLRLLVCADEEIRLRAPAGAEPARGAAAALVFECARENGDLVSVRKGAVWRTMELHGRAAHAGADTARGRSAVAALAREILRIEALADGRPDMTSVITTVSGGDSANTVPDRARATIDIRSGDPADLELAEAELDRAVPYDGITMQVSDRGTWPPMPRADTLVDAALAAGRELGLTMSEQRSGGVSDGCWTGEWGVPTIDGLGPVGGRDHTPEEWIEVATVPARIQLAARVVLAACAATSQPAAGS